MKVDLQLDHLHDHFDQLQLVHGSVFLNSIYGAGCINKPEIMFVFMNPTARNVASQKNWIGIQAPWLGIKNIWRMFHKLRLVGDDIFNQTQTLKTEQWDNIFSEKLYKNIAENKIYITNLAKCTQTDAKHLDNKVFYEYLELLIEEIKLIEPRTIVTFGTQVSSIVLGENIKISSDYCGKTIDVNHKKYSVIPVHYPVGHGQRNVGKSIDRINKILAK